MDHTVLEEIGLTKGEIKVYIALIDIGSTTTGAIIKATGMQRSAVYFCIETLVKKGLVGHIVKNRKKYFEANRPESLFEYLSDRKKEIDSSEAKLRQIVPTLFAKRGLHKKADQEAKVYEGWQGVLNAFFDVLDSLNPGDKGFAFTPTADYGGADPERVRRVITKVRNVRAVKKIRFRMLLCDDLKGTLGKDQEETPYTEVRYLTKDEIYPAVVNVYEDTTLIVLWTQKPVAFLIRSAGVAESFRNHFNKLWYMQQTDK